MLLLSNYVRILYARFVRNLSVADTHRKHTQPVIAMDRHSYEKVANEKAKLA